MAHNFSNNERIESPPPYVPSIDDVFLKKLSDGDQFLVRKLDEVNQHISWVVMLGIHTHNSQIELREQLKELKDRMDKFEQSNSPEDHVFLNWCRVNLSGPAKILFWLLGVVVVALVGAWISSQFPNR